MPRKRKTDQQKPSKPKPKTLDISVETLKEFKAGHGNEWHIIVNSPAFKAAMLLLNIRKLNTLTTLSNEDIEQHGREILADLRGHLQHENDLVSLHTKEDFSLPYEEPEDYYSPEQIAELESIKDRFRKERERERYG